MFIRNINNLPQVFTAEDLANIKVLDELFEQVLEVSSNKNAEKDLLIPLYKGIGDILQEIAKKEEKLHVYSFEQPPETHGQTSRLVSKLRDINTPNIEFTYYIQRAFEQLFNFAFRENIKHQKNYFRIATPVRSPSQNYAIHKLPNLDEQLHNTVICVMLRGALLPSMIMAKEIQEYSSIGYVPDFALFKISRDDHRDAKNMQYILREKSSYFDLASLDGKDLIFPDPMNATGGSIITVLEYLATKKITPRSIKLFHAISSLQGALQIIRTYDNVELFTLWVDPVLNAKAYIMPGLGDAGDRLNGEDAEDNPKNIIQLIAYYGQNILQLYRAQIKKIEETILGKME